MKKNRGEINGGMDRHANQMVTTEINKRIRSEGLWDVSASDAQDDVDKDRGRDEKGSWERGK